MNVPKLRFKEFNDEYKTYKFNDICTFFSGGTPTSSNKEYYNGSIPFIRSGEIYSDKTELHINQDAINNSSAKLVKKGDLLLALYGATSGNVSISKINGAINQAILCLRPNNNFSVIYIKYLLENAKDNILKTYLQGGQGNLSAEIIKKLNYLFPQKKEQEKIGNMLVILDKKIELQSKKIEDLKLFKKGLINHIIENIEIEKIPLKNILVEQNNKTSKNNEYEILSSTSKGIYLQKDYFNKQAASDNNVGYKILKKNQLVLSPQNLWMGNINVNTEYNIGIVSPSYKIFNISNNVNIDFFNYWIKSPKALFEYKISSEQGASIVRRNLNMDLFYEIIVDLPRGKLQNKVGKIIKLLNLNIQYNEFLLQKLSELKKGLMQNMFV